MNRRHFLQTIASTAAMAAAPLRAQSAAPRIDAARLRQQLEALSVFGRPAGGTFADGVSRDRLFRGGRRRPAVRHGSHARGRSHASHRFRGEHLRHQAGPGRRRFGRFSSARTSTRFRRAAISTATSGRSPPSKRSARWTPRASSPGILSKSWSGRTRRAGRFANGLNGSRAMAGQLVAGEMDQVYNGLRKADGIRRIGGNPDRIAEARRQPGSIHAYLELHIEQGGTLDKRGSRSASSKASSRSRATAPPSPDSRTTPGRR